METPDLVPADQDDATVVLSKHEISLVGIRMNKPRQDHGSRTGFDGHARQSQRRRRRGRRRRRRRQRRRRQRRRRQRRRRRRRRQRGRRQGRRRRRGRRRVDVRGGGVGPEVVEEAEGHLRVAVVGAGSIDREFALYHFEPDTGTTVASVVDLDLALARRARVPRWRARPPHAPERAGARAAVHRAAAALHLHAAARVRLGRRVAVSRRFLCLFLLGSDFFGFLGLRLGSFAFLCFPCGWWSLGVVLLRPLRPTLPSLPLGLRGRRGS